MTLRFDGRTIRLQALGVSITTGYMQELWSNGRAPLLSATSAGQVAIVEFTRGLRDLAAIAGGSIAAGAFTLEHLVRHLQ